MVANGGDAMQDVQERTENKAGDFSGDTNLSVPAVNADIGKMAPSNTASDHLPPLSIGGQENGPTPKGSGGDMQLAKGSTDVSTKFHGVGGNLPEGARTRLNQQNSDTADYTQESPAARAFRQKHQENFPENYRKRKRQ